MTTQLSTQLQFHAKPEVVYAMLQTLSYLESKVAGTPNATFNVSSQEAVSTVTVTRNWLGELPDMARKFLGDEVVIIEEQVWQPLQPNGTATATLNVSIEGAPVKVSATMDLRGTDSLTTITIEGNVKVSIPIFGSKAEEIIANELSSVMAQEQTAGDLWLASKA